MTGFFASFEADTLESAQKDLHTKFPGIPAGDEVVVSDGQLKLERAVADSIDEAFSIAQRALPPNVIVIRKTEISKPEVKMLKVSGFKEEDIKKEVLDPIQNSTVINKIERITSGKPGVLGIGRTRNEYVVEIFQRAVVEIEYKPKAKVSIFFSLDRLAEDLQCDNCEKRRSAAETLGTIGEPSTINWLVSVIRSEGMRIVRASMKGMGQVFAVGPYAEQLKRDVDAEENLDHLIQVNVRKAAGDALIKIGKDSIPSLLKELKDEDDRYVTAHLEAIRVLGELKAKKAVPLIIAVLEDKGSDTVGMRAAAMIALKQIGGDDAEQAVKRYQSKNKE